MSILATGRVVETREGMIVLFPIGNVQPVEQTWNVSDLAGAMPGDTVQIDSDGNIEILNRPDPIKVFVAPSQLQPTE